jgi:hypothetical protein
LRQTGNEIFLQMGLDRKWLICPPGINPSYGLRAWAAIASVSEAIHGAMAKEEWIASSLPLLAMTLHADMRPACRDALRQRDGADNERGAHT